MRNRKSLSSWAGKKPNLFERTLNEALAAQNEKIAQNIETLEIANDNGSQIIAVGNPTPLNLSDATAYVIDKTNANLHTSPNGNVYIS